MERFVRFNRDVSNMDESHVMWSKGNYYYIIKEKDNMIALTQDEYPSTECWIGKDCGDLFDILEYDGEVN